MHYHCEYASLVDNLYAEMESACLGLATFNRSANMLISSPRRSCIITSTARSTCFGTCAGQNVFGPIHLSQELYRTKRSKACSAEKSPKSSIAGTSGINSRLFMNCGRAKW